jgi:plastocyanin
MHVFAPFRRSVAVATATAVVASWLLVTVTAQAGDTRTVRVTGTETFVPNAKIMATLKFTPGPLDVASGTTVTWADETGDPHTISVVAAADVPATVEDVFACPVCGPIVNSHVDFSTNPPTLIAFVLGGGPDGTAGFDGVGDSLLLVPDGTATATITAPAGSTLQYICAIHPWMQGSIDVH